DDLPGAARTVLLRLKNIPAGKVSVQHFRIDDAHSNAYEAWKKMGSPQSVTEQQYKTLEQAGQLQQVGKETAGATAGGGLDLPVDLPCHAVSLLRVQW